MRSWSYLLDPISWETAIEIYFHFLLSIDNLCNSAFEHNLILWSFEERNHFLKYAEVVQGLFCNLMSQVEMESEELNGNNLTSCASWK